MHKIQNLEVTEKAIGSKVTFIPSHANGNSNHPDCDCGHIKSWNKRGIFVQYKHGVQLTNPVDLVWG